MKVVPLYKETGYETGKLIAIDEVSWFIGEAILSGMLLEVASYPKPGLVSAVSQGAHRDMNILTFMVSSSAISSSFPRFSQLGFDYKGNIKNLLPRIRDLGVLYEKKLLDATDNVNTQRGILFSGGILAAAAGFCYGRDINAGLGDIFDTVAALTEGIVKDELVSAGLERCRDLTCGEILFVKYGTTGIRGEVEKGFPSVAGKGIPAIKEAVSYGTKLNDCLVHALISLMTVVEDTTILWRKDPETLATVKERALEIIDSGSVFTVSGRNKIRKTNDDFIREGISPGGAADLLSITLSSFILENKRLPVLKM